jgi:uncharacterized protein (DUF927 family)
VGSHLAARPLLLKLPDRCGAIQPRTAVYGVLRRMVLRGLAAIHNDCLLILDELGQIDPREAGAAAYLLANGRGKTRATRNGTARESPKWRLLFLSSGEESLSAIMSRAGRRSSAGQEIRFADIGCDAGAGMGAFETLNGYDTPNDLAAALRDGTNRNHGAIGVEWIRCLVRDRGALLEFLVARVRQFVLDALPSNACGQIERVARRFGLAAAAGEMATDYGLTGWKKGDALEAASRCFQSWLDSFGGPGNLEERALLAQVKAFIEQHGASRFEDMSAEDGQRTINRAGFYRKDGTGRREHLILPQVFRQDVCAGFDPKYATRVLLAHGWLVPANDGRPTQKPRLPEIGPTRVYVLGGAMWEAGE